MMKRMSLNTFFAFAAIALTYASITIATPTQALADKFVTIGTGSVTGVYYPTGGAICRLVNRGRREHGVRCSVESTGGSVYNLNAIRNGEMDLAVAQSDWQYHAYKGTGPFAVQGPMSELRSVFSLHSEAFTIIARADSGINTLDDLKGKRVNIGNPGSGNRATMEEVMRAKGWDRDTFKLASELKGSEQPQALCDNKIDVMVYSAGHPNGAVQEAATSCNVKIIPVADQDIDKLVNGNSFYIYTNVPGGMYPGNPEDTKTFGVKATFVTSTDVDEDVVYRIVKSVFDNFDKFKTLHPVFMTLKPESLIYDGNTAPLHDGAKRYFQEAGLLQAAQKSYRKR